MLLSTARSALVAVCLFFPLGASAQTLSGIVTEAGSGEPIPGTTILVVGTQVGLQSGLDGQYELTLPPGERTVSFSFVGYRTQTVEVSEGQTRLDVALEEDLLGLDEVVVAGLGSSVTRENSALSVETISARELAEVSVPQTLDGALNGKITGAVVNSNSGAPGGGVNIRLRGITTINGASQPLYVVDGVIISNDAVSNGINAISAAAGGGNASNQDNPANRIADLPPEDIESIEILKGPSAAAIYGARAANGVVVIRTKSGQAGRTDIRFSQTLGFTTIGRRLGVRQFTAATAEESFGALGLELFNQNGNAFNYEDELFGNQGLLATSNLSISGGNDRTQFFLSGILKDDEGIVEGTGYEKQSARLNVTHQLSSVFEVDANVNYIRSVANRGITGNDNSGTTFGVGLTATPGFVNLLPDANGVYPDNPFNSSNFLQTRDLATIEETNNRVLASGRLTANVYRDDRQSVQLIGTGGVDYYALDQLNLFPVELQFEDDDGLPGTSIQGRTNNLNTNYQVLAVHAFAPQNQALSFRTQAGVSVFDQDFDNVSAVSRQIVAGQQNVNQGAALQAAQNQLFQRDRAFFAQEEVNYRDAVIGSFGVRAERSSANGDVETFYAYPKASLAVNLTNLGLLRGGPFELVKLRTAFGQTGNTAPFGSKFTIFNPVTIDGQLGLDLSAQRGFGDVTPERATEIEGGLDLTLYNGRVSLDATAYTKNVDNLLLQRQVPPSSGFGVEIINGGELRNNGVELGLSLIPVQTDALQWVSRTSFWANRAEVTRLDVPAFQATGGGFGNSLGSIRVEEGQSPTQIVGNDGDLDGDGSVDVVQLGDASPDFQMSFFNDFRIARRVQLTLFGHWKSGGDIINLTQLLSDLSGTSAAFNEDSDGDGVDDATQRLAASNGSARPFVQNASYFRLREVGLYYDVPGRYLGPLAGLRTLKVGASATNLFTITPYKSYDPEVSNFGNQPVASGVEVTPFPSSRSFNVHVSLGL